MATRKPTKKPARKSAKSASSSRQSSTGLTAEEKAAMRETIRERKSPGGEKEVLAKIAEMSGSDRAMAKRIHRIVTDTAPDLTPRTWYGMPAYAKDGKVLCYFQSAAKFKSRYATFGFNDTASLDQGAMWPTSFALIKLTPAEEKKIAALVKKAVR
jgi:uncharacterized protein YdhG (YjbR/CyaY superfamily)